LTTAERRLNAKPQLVCYDTGKIFKHCIAICRQLASDHALRLPFSKHAPITQQAADAGMFPAR